MENQQTLQDLSKNWIMKQSWRNLLFAHWPISIEEIQLHIPKPLQVDTFERTAWIGIVVFLMDGIFLSGMPKIPLFAKFPEINVRTYVRYNGKPGVYFLSLDAPHWITYTIAKKWYRLPYFCSKMNYQENQRTYNFNSLRNDRNCSFLAGFDGEFTSYSNVYLAEAGTIDHWLTERYCLYSVNKKGDIFCGEIAHEPWPLQHAKAEINHNTLVSPFNLELPSVKPLLHYSSGVDTLITNIKRVSSII